MESDKYIIKHLTRELKVINNLKSYESLCILQNSNYDEVARLSYSLEDYEKTFYNNSLESVGEFLKKSVYYIKKYLIEINNSNFFVFKSYFN